MSYPPYNPHESGMYPPPPQHSTTPLSYPVFPGSAAPPAPSAYPQSMPMPSANPYPYPGQCSPFSNQPAPYPSQTSHHTPSPYPPQPTSYPSQGGPSPYSPQQASSPYPTHQTSSTYPPQQTSSPPQPTSSPYPTQPTSSPYPTHAGSSPYPSQQPSSYPSQHSAYPNQHSTNQTGGGNIHGSSNLYSNPPYGSNSGQIQQPTIKKGTPTLRPAHPFNPREDAEKLRKAMKGFGTDEEALIQVLANRTNAQRLEISVQFKTLYGKDLIKDIKSEVSGNFEDVLVKMLTPVSIFLANEIHDAISGIGTDEETLIEILCTATNHDIHLLHNAYSQIYGHSMEDALASDTSGSFRRLLVSLSQGNRSENYQVDYAAAQSDAQALLRAGELQLGTDESTFNAILCSRSYPQLTHIFREYQNLTGHDFKKAIDNEFSGDIKEGLLAIVKSVENRPGYFAERLYQSMRGFGTKDRTLQRIVIVRSEIDMVEIKQSFQAMYGNSLEQFIKDDCSGDYKRTLVSLVS